MEYRLPITIPSGTVSEALVGFPVYVDLASMPQEFWDGLYYEFGDDIHVRDAGGSEIPFDLVWLSRTSSAGTLFIKLDLDPGADTTVYLYFGQAGVHRPAFSAVNGRNSVWSDYHRVVIPGISGADRTGSGSNTVYPQTCANAFSVTATSPDTLSHQGVAFDGTYFYTIDTNAIRKWDTSWNLVASNTNPLGDIGGGVTHCGDPEVKDGILYIPVEEYDEETLDYYQQQVAFFDCDDLSYIESISIAAQNFEPATLCYNSEENCWIFGDWRDSSRIWKYSPNFEFIEYITLSTAITRTQGITYWRGAYWVTESETNSLWRVERDGSGAAKMWASGAATLEGVAHYGDDLYVIHDTSGVRYVKKLTPNAVLHVAPGMLFGGNVNYRGTVAVSEYGTTHTIGASVMFTSTSEPYQYIVNYAKNGEANNDYRVGLGYRYDAPSNHLGCAQQGGWLIGSIVPAIGTKYRMSTAHAGASWRTFFENGARFYDTLAVAVPLSGANILNIGFDDASLTNPLYGRVDFIYLRFDSLSDAWLTSEYEMLSDNGSFVSIGSVETSELIDRLQYLWKFEDSGMVLPAYPVQTNQFIDLINDEILTANFLPSEIPWVGWPETPLYAGLAEATGRYNKGLVFRNGTRYAAPEYCQEGQEAYGFAWPSCGGASFIYWGGYQSVSGNVRCQVPASPIFTNGFSVSFDAYFAYPDIGSNPGARMPGFIEFASRDGGSIFHNYSFVINVDGDLVITDNNSATATVAGSFALDTWHNIVISVSTPYLFEGYWLVDVTFIVDGIASATFTGASFVLGSDTTMIYKLGLYGISSDLWESTAAENPILYDFEVRYSNAAIWDKAFTLADALELIALGDLLAEPGASVSVTSYDIDTGAIVGTGSMSGASSWVVERVADGEVMDSGSGASAAFSFMAANNDVYVIKFYSDPPPASPIGVAWFVATGLPLSVQALLYSNVQRINPQEDAVQCSTPACKPAAEIEMLDIPVAQMAIEDIPQAIVEMDDIPTAELECSES